VLPTTADGALTSPVSTAIIVVAVIIFIGFVALMIAGCCGIGRALCCCCFDRYHNAVVKTGGDAQAPVTICSRCLREPTLPGSSYCAACHRHLLGGSAV
jgi:hypothetical protein